MQLLNGLRSEIAQVAEMESRYDQVCTIIHSEYYKMFPCDNRSIDRTRPDYPSFLLVGIINKKEWD